MLRARGQRLARPCLLASLLTPAVKPAPSRAPAQVIIRGGEDGPDPRPAHETRRFGPSRTIGPDGGADRSNVKPRHHCPPPSASQKRRGRALLRGKGDSSRQSGARR